MNKCFITKLSSSVDNDNLPVLGQLKISWLKQSDLTDNDARALCLGTDGNITVKVSGAHFTDSTLTNNLGNTKTITSTDGDVWLYVSNDADAILTIDNKYSLNKLNFVKQYKESIKRSAYFDISDIKYCTNLKYLDLSFTTVSGDINELNKLTKLMHLSLLKTNTNGNISALSNLVNLTLINLQSTKTSGNISALSNLVNLTDIYIGWTNISGDINELNKLTKLRQAWLQHCNIIGDMSKMPANAYYIDLGNKDSDTKFTWTANSRRNVTFLSMTTNVHFDTASMDNMLIDQATCNVNGSSAAWQKGLSLYGNRTSASDDAITAIQNKGITIFGVTKVS